jgi:hypothetical protein
LTEFAPDPTKIGDDIGIKTIKTILNELIKLYQDKIWEYYAISVENHPAPDQYLQRWMSVMTRPINNATNPQTQSPRFASNNVQNENKPDREENLEIPQLLT